jgi:hypothetical protein
MITTEIIETYDCYETIYFNNGSLTKSNKNIISNYIVKKKPIQVKISGSIQKNNIINNQINENNILGTNDYFIVDLATIQIPIEQSLLEYLAYYNIKIINNDNPLLNLENNLPISMYKMNIGKNYVKNYLLVENLGNGFYIETHDLPHYYYCNDPIPEGFLIIGELIDNDIFLTGFKIPSNTGIYIPPNTFHSDAYLIGNYNVMYGKTPNYLTLIFKNHDLDIIDVDIK